MAPTVEWSLVSLGLLLRRVEAAEEWQGKVSPHEREVDDESEYDPFVSRGDDQVGFGGPDRVAMHPDADHIGTIAPDQRFIDHKLDRGLSGKVPRGDFEKQPRHGEHGDIRPTQNVFVYSPMPGGPWPRCSQATRNSSGGRGENGAAQQHAKIPSRFGSQ